MPRISQYEKDSALVARASQNPNTSQLHGKTTSIGFLQVSQNEIDKSIWYIVQTILTSKLIKDVQISIERICKAINPYECSIF